MELIKINDNISHTPIITEMIHKRAWAAKCTVYSNKLKFELTQNGSSEKNALDKINKFLRS